jgi:hypothetical protein
LKKDVRLILAAVSACALLAANAAGCTKNKPDETEPFSSSGAAQGTSASDDYDASGNAQTTRELQPGDEYAFKKFSGEIPDGYRVIAEEDFGIRYFNANAFIEIYGANYKEDYPELLEFAESVSLQHALGKMFTSLYEFDFSDPINASVAGFDAVRFNYDAVDYDWVLDGDGNVVRDEEGKEKRDPVDYLRGQMNYFFSDKDVYYIYFETRRDDWDKYYPEFEEFMKTVEIRG